MDYIERDRLSTDYANDQGKKPPYAAGWCGFIASAVVFTLIELFKVIAGLAETTGAIAHMGMSLAAGIATWLYYRKIENVVAP